MDTNLLKLTVTDQHESFRTKRNLIERKIPDGLLTTKKIVAISGIRRSGKSTLLWILSQKLNGFY